MGQQVSKPGWFKGLFGSKETSISNPSVAEPQPQLQPQPKPPQPRSETYHQRKKGRKTYQDTWKDLMRLFDILESRGEITPGELARELGIPRSTLTYHLGRFMRHVVGTPIDWGDSNSRAIRNRLKGKRLERLGGGQNVRYRIVTAASPEP